MPKTKSIIIWGFSEYGAAEQAWARCEPKKHYDPHYLGLQNLDMVTLSMQ